MSCLLRPRGMLPLAAPGRWSGGGRLGSVLSCASLGALCAGPSAVGCCLPSSSHVAEGSARLCAKETGTSGSQMIPLWGQQLLVLSGYHVWGWGCSAARGVPWVLGGLGPRPCCGVPSALVSTRGRGFRPIVCQGDWTSGGQMIPLWGQQLLVLSGYHVRGWGCSAAHSVAGEGLAYGASGAVCCGWGLGRSP